MDIPSNIRSPNFRRWLSSRFCSNFGKQMQELVVFWQVYQLTKDPLALGLIGLAEALPFIGISLWAGHVVDQNEKRRFMIFSEAGLLVSASILLAMTFVDHPPIYLFYVCIGLLGFCSSFENIASSAYAQTIIPKAEFPKAAAWNLAFFQAAIIAGPILGGWIIHQFSARAAFIVVEISLIVSLVLATTLDKVAPKPVPVDSHEESDWQRVKSGLKFIRTQRLILAAMSLDMVAVLFGDCIALFPIFADKLHVGPTGLGLLRAAPPIGSLILSTMQSIHPVVKVSWGRLKTVVLIFGICMIGFALSTSFPMAVLFLAIGGMADGTSVIIRQSIYQALTPDHLRGRVASVSLIFISSSNEIGAFESGLVAKFIGAVPSVVVGGLITLGTVGIASLIFNDLNRKEGGTLPPVENV